MCCRAAADRAGARAADDQGGAAGCGTACRAVDSGAIPARADHRPGRRRPSAWKAWRSSPHMRTWSSSPIPTRTSQSGPGSCCRPTATARSRSACTRSGARTSRSVIAGSSCPLRLLRPRRTLSAPVAGRSRSRICSVPGSSARRNCVACASSAARSRFASRSAMRAAGRMAAKSPRAPSTWRSDSSRSPPLWRSHPARTAMRQSHGGTRVGVGPPSRRRRVPRQPFRAPHRPGGCHRPAWRASCRPQHGLPVPRRVLADNPARQSRPDVPGPAGESGGRRLP